MSLFRKANEPLPEGCHCKPGKCMAPVIMGKQMPCRDPEKANAPKCDCWKHERRVCDICQGAERAVEIPELVKHMVNRFLMWKLPESFNPDGGISFKRSETAIKYNHPWPTGTNFLDADQAEKMVRYMLEGAPIANAERIATQAQQIQAQQEELALWRSEHDPCPFSLELEQAKQTITALQATVARHKLETAIALECLTRIATPEQIHEATSAILASRATSPESQKEKG